MKIESTLILGWNKKAATIILELDNYAAKGSKILVAADDNEAEKSVNEIKKKLKNNEINFKEANICDRKTLESLELKSYNHIIILCYSDKFNEQQADSKTLITLLHLRSIAEKTNSDFSIVSEMLDIRNKELAEITKADDFIISNKLISLMLSQLSENKHLKGVFDDLFDAEGSEIYLKPALNYVSTEKPANFYTVLESAAQKNEIAIGYRVSSDSHNASKAYGVKVNPVKSEMITFNSNDKIIVIAED